MSELVIQPRGSIKVRVGDKVYDVKKPSNKGLNSFLDEWESNKDSSSGGMKLMIKFLSELGMPDDVLWDLEADALEAISNALMPKKKG